MHSRLISGSSANAVSAGGGGPEVDRVPEVVAAESEPQRDRIGADRALHRVPAFADRAADLLGPGPQRGGQPALARECRHRAVARGVGQQPQRPVQA
jgi:hypothetical protein